MATDGKRKRGNGVSACVSACVSSCERERERETNVGSIGVDNAARRGARRPRARRRRRMRTSRGEVEAVHGEHRGLAGDGVGRYGGCGFRAEPEGLLRASRRRGREARRERRGEQPRADGPPAGRGGVSARRGWHLVSMAVNGSVTSPSTGLQRPQRAPPWRVEAVARRCEARRSESPTQNARAGLPGVAVVARGKKGIAPKRRVQTNVRLRRREQH